MSDPAVVLALAILALLVSLGSLALTYAQWRRDR